MTRPHTSAGTSYGDPGNRDEGVVDGRPAATAGEAGALEPEVTASRRKNMKAIGPKDTQPEMRVRRILHREGFRYRLHAKGLPGRPDIVFPARRKIIEIRGCFWHQHPDPNCKNNAVPATRRDWWSQKLAGNVLRDQRNLAALEARAWDVLVVWGCEVGRPDIAARLFAFLGPAGHAPEAR
jgi:DNA mismatch endonuclease Vsr